MNTNDAPIVTSIITTAEGGLPLRSLPTVEFKRGCAEGEAITLFPDIKKQRIEGIGTSFTESSAFVLSHLSERDRESVMRAMFGSDGARFSLCRLPIGSCDFCVEGRYSHAELKGDNGLSSFSIEHDKDGFSKVNHPGVIDQSFDLLPMIKEAKEIATENGDDIRLVASAWSAPPWMKDNNAFYEPGCEENHFNGSGGELLDEHYETYARYLVKFCQAYAKESVDVWGLTPVNEPLGNNGQWESMHFTPETQKRFVRDHLGPLLEKENISVSLLMLDHARDQLELWADTLYSDPQTAKYLYGAAVHWYESTVNVFEEVLEQVHHKYPNFAIIHTEGCIDNLGNDAPDGVLDPLGYKESGWFGNDSFWWNKSASDWAYSATWPGVDASEHPLYAPVHRYVKNIIVSLDHWVSGWIDWNCVLDERGGPNHVGNYCGAPIMIDYSAHQVYYTPVYYVLAQLSRSIRPGDYAIKVESVFSPDVQKNVFFSATVNSKKEYVIQLLNTDKVAHSVNIELNGYVTEVEAMENSLSTITIQCFGI